MDAVTSKKILDIKVTRRNRGSSITKVKVENYS